MKQEERAESRQPVDVTTWKSLGAMMRVVCDRQRATYIYVPRMFCTVTYIHTYIHTYLHTYIHTN
jgi:hypothetical protein